MMVELREIALAKAINSSPPGSSAEHIVETAKVFLEFLEDTTRSTPTVVHKAVNISA